ncbi:MAG: hypothetical protein ACXWG1_01520 [Usitatibacter sp.]
MHLTRAAGFASLLLALVVVATDAAAQAPAKSQIHDIVVLKDGTSINGDVKVATFTLKLKYGSLSIPKGDILEIEYRKPPNTPQDEVQISAGTRLNGDLLPATIKVNVDGLGDVDIPKSDILAMVLQRPIETLSPATRKALRRGAGPT